jgi:hypothetical protein
MSGWPPEDLAAVGDADEIRLASYRPDGSLRPSVRIWFVRLGEDLFVRSAYGPDNGWFRRALASGTGRIKGSGLERDVTFERAAPDTAAPLTAAYHAKYDRYGAKIVGTVVSDDAVACTLRLDAAPG